MDYAELLASVMEIIQFLIKLTEIVCVVVLLGYVVARAKFFRPFLFGERPRVRDLLLISAIFGLFSIYGTLGGAKIGNAVLNVRDAGPMIAGMVGGPVAGLLAGLIGGLHRLAVGMGGMADWTGLGYTCIPCAGSTMLVGLLAGLVRRGFGRLRLQWAVVFALLAESLHMILGLVLAGDPALWFTAESIAESWDLVISKAWVPMIMANGVGVGVFFYALENYMQELRTERERDEYYRQVELRNVELQTVHQISQDIAASLDLDPLLQTILGRVRQMIAYDRAEVCLYDKKDKVLRVRASIGSGDAELNTQGGTYKLGEGCMGWIGANRETLFIPDVEAHGGQEPIVGQRDGGLPLNGLLGVPLVVGQDIVGAVQLTSGCREAFDEHSKQLLETIAPHAAIAIQNAEQVMERERRLRAQIEQLRIEIDQVKRRRQVAEITDTEYFQELQKKSRQMRAASTDIDLE